MKKLIPEDLQDAVAAIAKTIEKVGGAIGGDICGKIDKIDLSKGFSTNVDVELALFEKNRVDIYAIVKELSKLEPRVKTLMTIIDSVFGEPLKKSLNNGVQSAMPAEQQFKISMGILIAKALNKAKPDAKAMVGSKLPILNETKDEQNISKTGRRLSQKNLAVQLISADGMFNLGGIPRSSKPGSKNKGDPNAEIQAELSTESTYTYTVTGPNVWEQLLAYFLLCGLVGYCWFSWKNKREEEKKKKEGYKPVKQSEDDPSEAKEDEEEKILSITDNCLSILSSIADRLGDDD